MNYNKTKLYEHGVKNNTRITLYMFNLSFPIIILLKKLLTFVRHNTTCKTTISTEPLFYFSGQLVIGIMTLSTVSVLTSIVILYFHHKGTSTRVPEKAKTFFFKGLATAMCMKGDVPERSGNTVAPCRQANETEKGQSVDAKTAWPVDVDDCPPVLADHDLQKLSNDLSYIANKTRKQDRDNEILDEWRALARILDRFLFWVSSVLVLIILLYFLVRKDPEY